MNAIQTIEQLKNYQLINCQQFWYYVIILNPRDLTSAGQAVFDNLNIFDLDSGNECQYFIPGFINTDRGIFRSILSLFDSHKTIIDIPNFGKLQFDDRNFVDFYKELEKRNNVGWQYSGECELLLFNLSMGNKIKLNNFISYNLDDIVRNKRNVSEFIRSTINVGKNATNQTEAKRMLDEKYYDMIMPCASETNTDAYEKGWSMLCDKGFSDDSYWFISYSSKDYNVVSEVRNKLKTANIPCWMAPFDIPTGSNYALIIEHAIKHAQKFVLMLSESAVQSVWVGKELKRAIARFQLDSPEKICIVWLKGAFQLQDTPFALPLEDVQIKIDLNNNPNNYYLLASKEQQEEIKRNNRIQTYKNEILNYLSPERMIDDLQNAVSRIYAILNLQAYENETLSHMCKQINDEIDSMKKETVLYSQEFIQHYLAVMDLLIEIDQLLKNIQ